MRDRPHRTDEIDTRIDDADADGVPWVTASAVGQATYCPYQLYLAHGGAERDAAADEALARGTVAHEAWTGRQRDGAARGVARSRRTAAIVALIVALVAAAALLVALLSNAGGVR